MQDGSGPGFGIPVLKCWRTALTSPVCDSGHLLEVDVCGHYPEVLALFEDSIQLLAVADAVPVLVVQEHRRPVVGADLMERVPSEIFVAHDLFTGELVECLLHPLEIALEFLLRRLPPRSSRS